LLVPLSSRGRWGAKPAWRSRPSKKENIFFRNQLIEGVEMTAELIAQLATLFLILGAGPIIVVLLYAKGGNL